MLAALFATSEITPPPGEHAKRRRVREEDEARERKKEHHEMKFAKRDSIADEEVRQIRVVEQLLGHLAREMQRQQEALLIVLFLMRELLRISRLHR